MEQAHCTALEELPNVGPAIAADLRKIGVHKPQDLLGRDPYTMFDQLSRVTGLRHDLCLLDVFISVVRFMGGEPKKPWWAYTAERKARLRTPSGSRRRKP